MEYYSDANNYEFSPRSKQSHTNHHKAHSNSNYNHKNPSNKSFDRLNWESDDFSGWDRTREGFFKDNNENGSIKSKK